jgi:hypothetical protein
MIHQHLAEVRNAAFFLQGGSDQQKMISLIGQFRSADPRSFRRNLGSGLPSQYDNRGQAEKKGGHGIVIKERAVG